MSKEKMLAARQLIKEKHYDEARTILRTIDHPTAREWLVKLDKIAPEKQRITLETIPYKYIIGFGVVAVALVVVILVATNLGADRLLSATLTYSGVTFRYPDGWIIKTLPYQIILSSKETTDINQASDLTPDTHVVFISVAREVNSDDTPANLAEETRQSLAEGYTDADGNVLQAPVETSTIDPVSIGNYSGVTFNFTLEGIQTNNIVLDTGNRTITTFTSISGNPSHFNPIIQEIINSYSFDPALAGDFACPVASWWENTAGSFVTRFLDTAEVAASTSRISVSPLIIEMQRTYRDFENSNYPQCVSSARDKLIDGMKAAIEGFTNFVGQSDTLATIYLDQAADDFKEARDVLWDMRFFGADIRLGIAGTLW